MFDAFFDSVCRMGIFVMCAQTILHFKPKEVYEKYLRYLVSLMVLIQLFLPLGGFLLGGGGGEIKSALKKFEEELQESMVIAEENAKEASERLESMTLEEVRKQMEAAQQEMEGATGNEQPEESVVSQEEYGETLPEENQEIKIETINPIMVGD